MQGLDGSVKIHAGLCRMICLWSGLCWCEDAVDAGRSCVRCRSSSEQWDPELWLLNRSCWAGAALCTCPVGFHLWVPLRGCPALELSTPLQVGAVWKVEQFPPCFLQDFKEDNSQPRVLHLDLSIPPRWAWLSTTTGNKSQSAAGEMQTVILHFSWASCTPELGAVLGTVPVPPLQLCQLCQHSLFPPLGVNAGLDTSWPVTDVHGPLHSGRISGYFPNVN